MRSSVKVLVIIAVVILFVGGIIMIVGYAGGGFSRGSVANGFSVQLSDTSRIENLDISVDYGEAHIVTGDYFDVSVENGRESYFSAYIDGSTLHVKYEVPRMGVFTMNVFGYNSPVVYITIPDDYELVKADIDVGAGAMYVDSLRAQKGYVDVGAGEFIADYLSFDECDLNCGVGSMIVSADISRKLKASCGAGNIEIILAGSRSDWDVSTDVGVGEVSVGGDFRGGLGNSSRTNKGADKQLDVQCGIGSVIVEFEEVVR